MADKNYCNKHGYYEDDICPFCLKDAAPDLYKELRKAHKIIVKLSRLVKHYGYSKEIPNIRKKERIAALYKATNKSQVDMNL